MLTVEDLYILWKKSFISGLRTVPEYLHNLFDSANQNSRQQMFQTVSDSFVGYFIISNLSYEDTVQMWLNKSSPAAQRRMKPYAELVRTF